MPWSAGAAPANITIQNDPDKISVTQEYLHGLRVALETERRRVEELEAEVCRLNRELAEYRVSDGFPKKCLNSSNFLRCSVL